MDKQKKSLTLLNCTKIHEPCFPYFGSVYMTLLSVMQGIVLASIFLPATSLFFQNKFIEIIKAIPILILAVTLWHKYVNHHQILGWQLGPMDTIIVAAFGLLQAIMVSIANLQGSLDPKYIFNGNSFNNQILYLSFCMTGSILLGIIAYAHSGAKASAEYVKKAIIGHHNSCQQYNNSRNHCTYKPENLYSFLIGFEAHCVFGTIITGVLLLLNILLYTILIKTSIGIIYSSIISTIFIFFIIYHYLWRYEFKREISDETRIHWLTTIGDSVLNQKWKNSLAYWIFIVPFLVFNHCLSQSKFQEMRNKARMGW